MDWNVIPFRRRKRFDWLEGITPRKRSWRFPITAAAGLVVGVMMAVVAIWLPPIDFLRLQSTSISPQHHSEDARQSLGAPSQGGRTEEFSPTPALSLPGVRAEAFSLCFVGSGYNCVVDGDTFWYRGSRIRIADIDTPETHPPRCAQEAELGHRATLRLQELLNQGPFTLEAIDRDHDQYGRQLRIVKRGSASLGAQLVDEGLARRWTGSRQPWC